jgi:hypothetical protein
VCSVLLRFIVISWTLASHHFGTQRHDKGSSRRAVDDAVCRAMAPEVRLSDG